MTGCVRVQILTQAYEAPESVAVRLVSMTLSNEHLRSSYYAAVIGRRVTQPLSCVYL